MNGKGSKQRPTDTKKFNDNWDKIYGKKKCPKKEEEVKEDKPLTYSRQDTSKIIS